MSKQIHDEDQRRKQVKFRADESLVEEFDATIDGSRSEALREAMRTVVERTDGDLVVPTDDEELADAYRWLVAHSNDRGNVPLRLARKNLAQTTGYSQEEVRRFVLVPLARRGYVSIDDAPPGVTADGVVHVREIREE